MSTKLFPYGIYNHSTERKKSFNHRRVQNVLIGTALLSRVNERRLGDQYEKMVPPTIDAPKSSANEFRNATNSNEFSETQMSQLRELFESFLDPIHQRLDAIEDALGITIERATATSPNVDTLNALMGTFLDLNTNAKTRLKEISSTSMIEAMKEKQNRKTLKSALSTLTYLFKGEAGPSGKFAMDPLSCIPSEELATESDQWWSSLTYNYKLDDMSVVGDVLPIFGCYLDLHTRAIVSNTSKLGEYGEDFVCVYVPTDTVRMLKRQIQKLTGHVVAQGEEIIDDKQGLTSFIAFTAPEGASLMVAMYKNKRDSKENKVPETQRKDYPLSRLYKSAESSRKGRILGGIAMLNAIASFSCEPESFNSNGNLPNDIPVELKIELSGFHCLGLATEFVQQIK